MRLTVPSWPPLMLPATTAATLAERLTDAARTAQGQPGGEMTEPGK